MKKITHQIILVGVLFSLVACQNILGGAGATATPPPTAPLPTETTSPDQASPTLAGPMTLEIWLPPEFAPTADTPSGDLLNARLDAFAERHPGVRVEVRIKSETGTAGLFESLVTTSAAAPLALPDLIALPGPQLSAAAERGLISPLDELLSETPGEDWYNYALQLGSHKEQTYGLTFAGDALVLAFRPSAISDPPTTWEQTINARGPFAFPAADPQALFGLTLYLAQISSLEPNPGQISLDQQALENVFRFFEQGQAVNLFPFWLTQYDTEELSWQTLRESRAFMGFTWATRVFAENNSDINAAPLPTPRGTPFTLASGWTLALSSPDPERQAIAVELAEFLTEGDFVGQWTQATGYLPPRRTALAAWQNSPAHALAAQILPNAQAMPTTAQLTFLGDLLSAQTIALLKKEISPVDAANAIIQAIGQP